MIYKLTKFKRDGWIGLSTFSDATIGIGPEVGIRGLPVTGLSQADARRLEEELGLQKYTLNDNSPYWVEEFNIPFPANNKGLTLDDEHPRDQLFLSVLRTMKKVAVGREELKTKSKAEYLLTSDQKIEQEDNDVFSVKEDAYGLLSKATGAKLSKIYAVLEKTKKNSMTVDTSSMSDLAIKNGLRKVIEANPQLFITVATDQKLNLKAKIIDLVVNRIISTNNSGYFKGKDQIAYDLDSMVAYMEDPMHQNMVIQFEQELKAKKS